MLGPSAFLLLSGIRFGIGVAGVVTRKNVLIILMSVEIMLNAVNVAFIAVGSSLGDVTGSVFAFMVMTVAAAGGGGGRRARAWDSAPRGFVPRSGLPRGRPPRGSPVPETGLVPRSRGGGGLLSRCAPCGPRLCRAPGPR